MSFEIELPATDQGETTRHLDSSTKRALANAALPANPADTLDATVISEKPVWFDERPMGQQTAEQIKIFERYFIERAIELVQGNRRGILPEALAELMSVESGRNKNEMYHAIRKGVFSGELILRLCDDGRRRVRVRPPKPPRVP